MARGEDGQALSLNLLFERSGNELYYSYGPGNRAPIAEYSGSWLILDGEGGAYDFNEGMLEAGVVDIRR